MESIVINIGGSVIFSDDIDIQFFKKLKDILINKSKKYKIYIVVGGGKIARMYINYGREHNLSEKTLDQFGIDVTRLNAKMFSEIMGISNNVIPLTTADAKKINAPIVVMGGTVPGHSTDMVSAELAEKVKASKFIIATNVDGVYDKDPNKNKDAKQLKEVNIQTLIDIYGTGWISAGKNVVIDGPALKIIKDAKLPTFVLNGKKLTELEKVLNNQKFNGTVIKI
jgi:uridylate kinase